MHHAAFPADLLRPPKPHLVFFQVPDLDSDDSEVEVARENPDDRIVLLDYLDRVGPAAACTLGKQPRGADPCAPRSQSLVTLPIHYDRWALDLLDPLHSSAKCPVSCVVT